MQTAKEIPVRTATGSKRRWLLTTAFIALAALVIAGIVLALHWPFSSRKVVQAVQQDWPGKISVRQFSSIYFPHPGCVLEGVTLTRGSDSGAPLVAIRKVTIKANYHDLLLRPGYVSGILLEGLKISVPTELPKDASPSVSNSSRSSIRLGEVFTKDATLEIATKSDGPLTFDIHELTLKSITPKEPMSYDLAMRMPEPSGEIRSHGKLGPWNTQQLETIPLSGNYTLDKADLGVYGGIAGTLSAKGEFEGVLGKIETHGTTEIPDFEVTRSHHTVNLKTKFSATVDGTGGDTELNSVDGTFRHTVLHADGSVASQPGQPGKTTTVNLKVQGGRIDDVLYLFDRDPKPPMEGATAFRARVVWPSGSQSFLRRVKLQGDFTVQHAKWENAERQANVNELSKRASGLKKEAATPEVTADIQGNVVLSNEIATLKDTSCKIPGAEAQLSGTYNLENKKIDFHGELKTEGSISDDTTGAKAVLLKPLSPLFKRKRAGAVVPVAMTGTYDDPHFGLNIPGK